MLEQLCRDLKAVQLGLLVFIYHYVYTEYDQLSSRSLVQVTNPTWSLGYQRISSIGTGSKQGCGNVDAEPSYFHTVTKAGKL